MRQKRTIITTTCDRPRCGRTISEQEEEDAPLVEKDPDLVVKRAGKPDIVYKDVCDICTKATDNYVLGIEKKPRRKEEPAAPVEPVDPGAPRWVEASEEWLQGDADACKAYSYKAGHELTIVIPALEDVTDPAEAGALIDAYEEPGESSDR